MCPLPPGSNSCQRRTFLGQQKKSFRGPFVNFSAANVTTIQRVPLTISVNCVFDHLINKIFFYESQEGKKANTVDDNVRPRPYV